MTCLTYIRWLFRLSNNSDYNFQQKTSKNEIQSLKKSIQTFIFFLFLLSEKIRLIRDYFLNFDSVNNQG
ncbi:hypothetical protein C7B62_23150 [Pleurocapsa sp. CCALA 161]|nr:hypothetical protein C7B62_23150 [Pleurocapsa sp. CCALA 161]